MKRLVIGGVVLAVLCLGGCKPAPSGDAGAPSHGRYLGIGVYSAGRLWSKIVTAGEPAAAAAAKVRDDDEIVVVVDSATGEVRQCGNLTGYCVGMNPWTRPLGASRTVPVNLSLHADQLAAETITVVDASSSPAASSSPSAPSKTP